MNVSNCELPAQQLDNRFTAMFIRRLHTRDQPFTAMRIAMARGRGHALEGRAIEEPGWYPAMLGDLPKRLREAYLRGYARPRRYVMVTVN